MFLVEKKRFKVQKLSKSKATCPFKIIAEAYIKNLFYPPCTFKGLYRPRSRVVRKKKSAILSIVQMDMTPSKMILIYV